jgi:hypothetical protein
MFDIRKDAYHEPGIDIVRKVFPQFQISSSWVPL